MDTSDLGPKCPDTSDLKVQDTSDLEFLVYFSVTTYMLWCTCSPRGDASVTGKMVRDTSDLAVCKRERKPVLT